jgi:hypothetical protein
MTIVVALVLAAAVVVVVALPFLREPVAADDRLDAPGEAEERRLLLVDERDRALAALKELEFDHRSGKIDDADYRALVGPLRREAAAALKAVDAEARYRARMIEEPAPPPDEGTPPTPVPVPEPYPPPDEATIPSASQE